MSEIFGKGWGSAHSWRREITDRFSGGMGTRYFCRDCGECFVHLYNVQPGIFTAMHDAGVPEVCPGATQGADTEPRDDPAATLQTPTVEGDEG